MRMKPRVDQILDLICREAKERKGVDRVAKLYTVYKEVGTKFMALVDGIRERERETGRKFE